MTGCSAPNCSNQSKNGFKFYRFPADPERRNKWLINCRRQDWTPTQNARLCSEHFEECQIEQSRADGKKRLLPFAVPTIFNVSNPPKLFDPPRISLYKRSREESQCNNVQSNKRSKLDVFSDCTNLTTSLNSNNLKDYSKDLLCEDITECQNTNLDDQIHELKNKCAQLEEELKLKNNTIAEFLRKEQFQTLSIEKKCAQLEEEIKAQNNAIAKFLTKEQFQTLSIERKCIKKWSHEGITKGLKLRFALGKNGYNFLRGTGYPAPSYSTLNKRVSSIKLGFGVLHAIVDLLAKKVESMQNIEKDCSLMVDEMEISHDLDFDKSKKTFVGQVTLGDTNKKGNHLTVVAIRGLNTSWKQIIGCHVTGPSTNGSDMKKFILEVIQATTSIGLNVRSICSDMGSNNKALWTSLGICVSRDQEIISFKEDSSNRQIYVLADAPHLLKNWKQAIQRSQIYLPREVILENDLPTNVVTGKNITDLWNYEMKNTKRLQSLHHLTQEMP